MFRHLFRFFAVFSARNSGTALFNFEPIGLYINSYKRMGVSKLLKGVAYG